MMIQTVETLVVHKSCDQMYGTCSLASEAFLRAHVRPYVLFVRASE